MVKKGQVALQIQTEYAHRPMPRITTTIQEKGRVVHKVERNLGRAIESIEEKNRMEQSIKRQHTEVISIIKRSQIADIAAAIEPDKKAARGGRLSIVEQLQRIPGIHRIYHVDNEGNFSDADATNEFKRNFGPILKGLPEIIDIFSLVPGVGITRERGVYEVERSKLYLISEGSHFYFFYVLRADSGVEYEKDINDIVSSTARS